jgi:hypothetical protein
LNAPLDGFPFISNTILHPGVREYQPQPSFIRSGHQQAGRFFFRDLFNV